jgi:4-amino-4-deoxy-L-arabinose transferase-like glycosyltransferase
MVEKLLRVAGLLAILVALLLGLFALQPYATVKRAADSLASRGNYEELTEEAHRTLRHTWLLVSAVYLGVGLTLALRPSLARLVAVNPRPAPEPRDLDPQGPEKSGADRAHWFAFVLILVLSSLVRITYAERPLHLDESVTIRHLAPRGLASIVTDCSTVNNHILNTVLIHWSVGLFGYHLWAMRLPCLLAGIALLPATYACGRSLFNKDTGLLAMALVGITPISIAYSANARGYSFVCLFFALALTFAGLWLRQPRPRWLGLLVVSMGFCFFSMPSSLYPFSFLFWWLILNGLLIQKRSLRHDRPYYYAVLQMAIATGVLAFVLYTPALLRSGLEAFTANKTVLFTKVSTLAELWASLVKNSRGVAEFLGDGVPLVLAGLFGVVLAVGLLRIPSLRRAAAVLILAFLLGSLPLIALQRLVPYARVWTWVIPLAFVLIALGQQAVFASLLGRMPRSLGPAFPWAVLALFVVCMGRIVAENKGWYSREDYAFDDAPEVATFLRGYLKDDDAVAVGGLEAVSLTVYLQMQGIDEGRVRFGPRTRRVLIITHQDGLPSSSTPAGVWEEFCREQGPGPVPLPATCHEGSVLVKDFRRSAIHEMRLSSR